MSAAVIGYQREAYIRELREALRAIAEGRPRSAERYAALVLDGASPEDAAADDDRRWRAEVGS